MERRDPWDIPAVRAGMERLLAHRRELLDDGAEAIGWKLAFGTEVAMSTLGTTGPLVGFLTDRTLLAPGGEVSIERWTAPKLEPEIAIHLGEGGEAIGIAAAIELADADRPPTDTEEVLAGDIYHRAAVLDRAAEPGALTHPLAARIDRDGEEIAATEDAETATGPLADLVAWTRIYLEHFGETTVAGEVIISGSVVGLLDIAPGQRLTNNVAGVGSVAVSIA